VQAYMTRLRARAGYQLALETCCATRRWWTS
jgi:glutathione S-transferase